MIEHHGSCHCGAVKVVLRETPTELAECNCSLCRRLGGLWHHGALDRLTVTGSQTGYVQGDATLTNWHCPTCGCTTHWTPLIPDYDRMGINLRMFDPALWQDLPRRQVDGASF